jgi:hypothetical protein
LYVLFAPYGLLVGACLSVAAVVQYVRQRVPRAFPTWSVALYGTAFLLWAAVMLYGLTPLIREIQRRLG